MQYTLMLMYAFQWIHLLFGDSSQSQWTTLYLIAFLKFAQHYTIQNFYQSILYCLNSSMNNIADLKNSQKKVSYMSESELRLTSQPGMSVKQVSTQPQIAGQPQNEQDVHCCMAPFRFMADFINIYKFEDGKDSLLMVIAIILALISGVSFPLFMYFWGKQIDHVINDIKDLANNLAQSQKYFFAFLGLGIGSFIINGIIFALWKLLSETTANRMRVKYLGSFIKRSMKWIESKNLYEMTSRFKLNCETIQKATGDKVALFSNLIGVIISGTITAVCIRWTFSLYLFALVPIGMAALSYFIYILIMRKIEEKQFYSKAEAQSAQAVTLIKTVKLLGAQKFQELLYNKHLADYEEGIKGYPYKIGISIALFYFIQYFMFGVGFIYGIQCVRGTSACPVSVTGSHYTVGDLHITFFEIFLSAYYFLQLAANFDAIRNAIKSSKEIEKFMKQTDLQNEQQNKMQEEKAEQRPLQINQIEFKDVIFSYPSNPKRYILKKLSFKLLKNKFNAIVGVTGSGKSTITQLIMKFYNPVRGQILIGNRNILDVDAKYLRERIGYVGQEPVLFSGTIRENVVVGKVEATDDEIWQALRHANIDKFVLRLPQGLDYNIGFGGAKLSGGQKQRIAIARALIKKPQLLILDQATSALDRKSQKIIQKTFQQIFLSSTLNMTVICIAHKIRTIRKADWIWKIEKGVVKQEGKFEDLNCFKDVDLTLQDDSVQDFQEEQLFLPLGKTNTLYCRQKVEVEKEYQGNIYLKLIEYTEHKGQYIVALFMAFLNGLSHPAAVVLLCYMYAEEVQMVTKAKLTTYCESSLLSGYLLDLCLSELDQHHTKAIKYLAGLIGFSIYAFFPYFVQFFFMAKIQDEITEKVRKDVFKKLMLMPAKWYDKPQNDGGQVASKYGLDIKEVSSLVTNYIPILITNATTIVGGVALCLAYFWKIGLLSLVTIPLIAIGGYITMIFISGYQDDALHQYDEPNRISAELMINIKTAVSLNYQMRLLEKYKEALKENKTQILIRGGKIGFFFGVSLFLVQATIGSTLLAADNILAYVSNAEPIDIMISLVIPTWCGWIAGNSFYFAAHAGAGKRSAKNIFTLLQEKTEAEHQQLSGVKNISPPKAEIKGRIEFKNVSFRYSQEEHSKYVLKDINLVIEPGQKAAFVGESGCGKSTLMLLLQRFYDYEGEITLDGVNILEYDLHQYRNYFAVLNQEPSLFSGTIQNNIVFNSDGGEVNVIQACKMSFVYDVNRVWKGKGTVQECIKDFLSRDVGPKGSKLSGGEKQRVACARAILRNPRMFLMDEGTSALDRETEKKVQSNIDAKLKGVTTVNIAHRMETIENSDAIFMLEDGKIIERGRYAQMMERRTHFFRFVNGSRYRTIDQIAEHMLNKLVIRLLGLRPNK